MASRQHPWSVTRSIRPNAFGRSSKLAATRLREAMAEIRAVAGLDPVLAAEGAVQLLERISPAFESVDMSSAALGSATNKAVSELITMLCAVRAEPEVRRGWRERLARAADADGIGFLHDVRHRFGMIAGGEATPTGVIVSETFLDFLRPFWEAVEDDRAAIEALLKVGQTVWNAVVLADQVGDPKWLAAVRERVVADPSMVQIEAMIAAKRRKFGMHHWLVGVCELFERDGVQRLRVGATAADQVQLG